MFGTDLGCGVDDLLNQPCEVAEKSLEVRNHFFQKKIKIVSVETILAFFDCDLQGQLINVGMGRGTLSEHTPIPWVGTLHLMCPGILKNLVLVSVETETCMPIST